MTHPAVVKAKKIARVALENGWKGSIEHESGTTDLTAWRDDERIHVKWIANTMESAEHTLFSHVSQLSCAKAVLKVIEGTPDIMVVIKNAPLIDRPKLVEKYRVVPFDWEHDDDETIIANVLGRKLFWYSHQATKIQEDVVYIPKGKKNHIEIKPVAHRKMLNFVGQGGFRSVLLDTIIKVA